MFHVPNDARVRHGPMKSDAAYGNNGAFIVPSVEPGWKLWIIASDGAGWEHVSVCVRNEHQSRLPTWKEMVQAKHMFWDDEDVAVQYHPRQSQYVNTHPHVLHLWRAIDQEFPTPPSELVG